MDTRFAVVDIETSGLSPERHRILQIAVVTFEAGQIVAEWESLVRVRWWQRIGPRRVHHIRRRDLRHAPELGGVLGELVEHLDGAVFVAHNVGFDWRFLRRAADHTGVALPDAPRLCTLQLSRTLDPDRLLTHGLSAVAARYGVVNDRPHDALHDARTTALVLPHLLQAAGTDDGAALARQQREQARARHAA